MAVSINEFEKALVSLEIAIQYVQEATHEGAQKLFRDGAIQRFEFSVELAWKTAAKILGSGTTAPKPMIREMAQNHLIENIQSWFDFIDARNKSSHSYNENVAQEVFNSAKIFLPEGFNLLQKLKTL